MVAEEIARRLAAAAAEGVIKEAAVQVFVVQPGTQSAAVLAQVGDGGGFIGKQIAQGQGVLLQVSDDVAHAVRQAHATPSITRQATASPGTTRKKLPSCAKSLEHDMGTAWSACRRCWVAKTSAPLPAALRPPTSLSALAATATTTRIITPNSGWTKTALLSPYR